MREIKFRAWDIANKRMIDDAQEGVDAVNEEGHFILGLSFGKLCRDAGNHMMQYIGIKDKCGKEIYDGDIYASHTGKNRTKNNTYFVGVVTIYPYRLWVSHDKIMSKRADKSDYRYSPNEHVTIIGNIYENPELLKAYNH